MAILNKEQILAADDLPRETVTVAEWGGDVIVQGMSAEQVDSLLGSGKDNNENFAIALLAASLVDESGTALFTQDDIAELKKKNSIVLSRLAKICTKLNKLDRESAEKNSPPAASEISA